MAEWGLCLCRCVPSCAQCRVPAPGHHLNAHRGCPWCWTAATAAGYVHGGSGSPATTSTSVTPARAWCASSGQDLEARGPCASVSRFAGLREGVVGGEGRSRPWCPQSKGSLSLPFTFNSDPSSISAKPGYKRFPRPTPCFSPLIFTMTMPTPEQPSSIPTCPSHSHNPLL